MTLYVDQFMRVFGLARAARAELDSCDEASRSRLQAYADGVNAAITAMKGRPLEFRVLGYEPEPWRPEDSLAWFKLIALYGAANWQEEIVRAVLANRLGSDGPGICWTQPARNTSCAASRVFSLAAFRWSRHSRPAPAPGGQQQLGRGRESHRHGRAPAGQRHAP
jgi:penicillin amidase